MKHRAFRPSFVKFIIAAALMAGVAGCRNESPSPVRANESPSPVPAPCRKLASPAAREFPRCAELMARDTNRTCAPRRFAHHAPVDVEILSYCAELEYDDQKRSPRR